MHGRGSVGGLPCEIVHGTVTGESCIANFVIRGLHAFLQAFALYAPVSCGDQSSSEPVVICFFFQVHVSPILIRQPQRLLNFHSILETLLGILRSASFLSAFVSSFWAAVCFTRTLVIARVLPVISHDFYDGPFGCVMAGCLVCGSSIWIESGRRRGEMALYVLPRAIRACLPDRWLRSGRKGVYAIEQLVFFSAGIVRTDILTLRFHPPGYYSRLPWLRF